MTISTDSLTRAVEYLGATDLGDGRYAKVDFGKWKTYDAQALINRRLGMRDRGVLMPSWWTPTQQFATRYVRDVPCQEYVAYATPQEAHATIPVAALGTRCVVTANLETGEEIPA